ncbi:hypothetical protein, partial [Desulfosporosinus lacus]
AFLKNFLTSITIGSGVTIGDYLLLLSFPDSTYNNNFRDAYVSGGAGTYTGTQTGPWTKVTTAVGGAAATAGTMTITYTLTTGTFAAAASTVSNWTISGANGAELGAITGVVLSNANTTATITVTNNVGAVGKVYTVAPAQATFAAGFIAPAAATVGITVVAVPTVLATDGSFTDTDVDANQVAGTIAWTAASPPTGITGYKIYWGSNATTILAGTSEVQYTVANPATASQPVAANTALPAGATHYLIYSYNAEGNSTSCLAVAITDLTQDDVDLMTAWNALDAVWDDSHDSKIMRPVYGTDTNILMMASNVVDSAVAGVTITLGLTDSDKIGALGAITYTDVESRQIAILLNLNKGTRTPISKRLYVVIPPALSAQSGSPAFTDGTPATYGTQMTVGAGSLTTVTHLTYTWYSSVNAIYESGTDTSRGTGTTYTPVAGDVGKYLIVVATSTDATGNGIVATAAVVAPEEVNAVAIDIDFGTYHVPCIIISVSDIGIGSTFDFSKISIKNTNGESYSLAGTYRFTPDINNPYFGEYNYNEDKLIIALTDEDFVRIGSMASIDNTDTLNAAQGWNIFNTVQANPVSDISITWILD